VKVEGSRKRSPYNCRGMETSREGSTTTNTHLTYPTLPTLTPPTLTPTLAPTQLFLFQQLFTH